MICPFCKYEHDNEGDRYGCPNCLGEPPQEEKAMQVTIEIHPAFNADATMIVEHLCEHLDEFRNQCAPGADRVADTIAAEVRAQLEEPEFHFFASSGLHWHTGTDLLEVLTRQRKADTNKRSTYQAKGCTVYRVPGPETRHYKINHFVPQVDGVTTVAEIRYDAKAPGGK